MQAKIDIRSRDGLSREKTTAPSPLTFLVHKRPSNKTILLRLLPWLVSMECGELSPYFYLAVHLCPMFFLPAKVPVPSAMNAFLSHSPVTNMLILVVFLSRVSPFVYHKRSEIPLLISTLLHSCDTSVIYDFWSLFQNTYVSSAAFLITLICLLS